MLTISENEYKLRLSNFLQEQFKKKPLKPNQMVGWWYEHHKDLFDKNLKNQNISVDKTSSNTI